MNFLANPTVRNCVQSKHHRTSSAFTQNMSSESVMPSNHLILCLPLLLLPWADPSSGVAPLALTANCTDPILQKRKPRLGDVAKSPSRRVVELGLKCRPLSSRAGASLSLTLELLTSGHLPSSPCAPSGQQLCFIQLCIPAVLVPKPQAKEPRRQPPLGSSLKTQVPGPHSQLLQQHLQRCGS